MAGRKRAANDTKRRKKINQRLCMKMERRDELWEIFFIADFFGFGF
jgi:hypothetical protein